MPGPVLDLQPADGARRQHLADAEAAQRPHVRAVRHLVRREVVVRPVARQEGDGTALDGADRDRGGRLAVRGVDLDLLGVVEERVEAAIRR